MPDLLSWIVNNSEKNLELVYTLPTVPTSVQKPGLTNVPGKCGGLMQERLQHRNIPRLGYDI